MKIYFFVGIMMLFVFCFIGFQAYLLLNSLQLFFVDSDPLFYFSLALFFNLLTAFFLFLHTKEVKSLKENIEALFLVPKKIFRLFFVLAMFSNILVSIQLSQGLAEITSYKMKDEFWFLFITISFLMSAISVIVFKLILGGVKIKRNYKIKTPLDSVFIEADC